MSNGEYSEMIELPVSTCEMVVAPKKKRKLFKDRLIKTVNKKAEETESEPFAVSDKQDANNTVVDAPAPSAVESYDKKVKKEKREKIKKANPAVTEKKTFKFDLVAAEVIAVFVLIVAILLTNIFWEDSGINTMIRSVFGAKAEKSVDARTAKDLATSSPSSYADVTVEGGVMTFNEAAAVYAPAGGEVTAISQSDGVFTLTIKHSDVFSTVISGAEAVYAKVGEKVYSNIPVAYSVKGTKVAMYDDGTLAADYTLDNGKIVWQS